MMAARCAIIRWINPQSLTRASLLAALAAAVLPAAALAAPAATAPPTVRGTLAFGQTVRCEPGSWSGDPVAFRYDWIVNGSSRGSGQTFAIDDPYDRSHPLACQVTATDASGATGVAGSQAAQPAAGRAKLVITRFVAQRRGRILVTGRVAPAAIASRWAIQLDFRARANTLWDPANVTRTLRISSGGRGCGGCSVLR